MTEGRYVVSEVFPVAVMDNNTGDNWPIADGVGFAEEMCTLLNQKESTIQNMKEELDFWKHSETITDQKELQKIIYKIVRDLIDAKFVKARDCYSDERSDSRYYAGKMDALRELKEELMIE